MALDFASTMQIFRNEQLPEPKNPNRHPADVLRVQYWFHGVSKEGANKRGNSSRLTQSFHFFMFEPIFSPVNALNQPI